MIGRWADRAWREHKMAQGCRVTGSPEKEFGLEGRIISSLRAGMKRVKLRTLSFGVESITPAHTGLDLYYHPDNWEDDPGDWVVVVNLRFDTRPGFWSKLSQAGPAHVPAPHKPQMSLLTPEEDAARSAAWRVR